MTDSLDEQLNKSRIKRLKKEIEYLQSDSEQVENLVSRSVLEHAIHQRKTQILETCGCYEKQGFLCKDCGAVKEL